MKTPAFAILLAVVAAGSLQAGSVDTGKIEQSSALAGESLLDKIWDIPKLYRNDRNPVVEEIDAIGRFQEDYFNVDSDRGHSNFWEVRRFRLGADAFFLDRHLEVQAEVDTALRAYNAPSVFYNRMTNLWARIEASEAFAIRFGKFQPHFGYDREFSNRFLETFERGLFDDQLLGSNDYMSGVEVSGNLGHFGYLAAVYSTNIDKEFGQFDGGQAGHAEINYDFAPAWHADKALWVLDYLHAEGKNPNTTAFRNYRDALVTYLDYGKNKVSLVTQLGYGHQIDGKGDLYTLQLMPAYKLTDKLELIVRYQLGLATQSNGITTLNRQQKTIGSFTGDNYQAVYTGLDYYLYGQKFKVMFGEEYARLTGGTGTAAGFEGWTTLVGLRLFF